MTAPEPAAPRIPPGPAPSPSVRLAMVLIAFLPAAVTGWVLAALRSGEMLDLGDRWFLAADGWRGLGADQARWMLETSRGGARQPLAWLSFALDDALSGSGAAHLHTTLHTTQWLLHALAAATVGCLTYALLATSGAARVWRLGAPMTAGLAAVAWGVHPLRVEPVATLSARGDVLAAVFGGFAATCWVGALAGPKLARPALALAAVASLCAALASPGAAALVVGLWALGRWIARVRPDSRAAKGSLTWPLAVVALPPVLSFVATLGVRAPDAPVPAAASVASLGHALLAPLWDTVWPAGLHPFHDTPPGYPDAVPLAWWMQTGIVALLLGRALLRVRRGRGGSLALVACWSAAAVAWALGREGAGSDTAAYLATVPLFVAVGVAIGEGAGCVLWFLGAPVVALLAVVPGWISHGLAAAWTDDATLSARVLAADPSNDRVQSALGDAARRRGAVAEAAAHYERSLAAGGRRPYAEAGLGALALDRGDLDAAAGHLERAAAAAPWLPGPYVLLGAVRAQQGKFGDAVRALESAVRLDGASPAAWFALGRAHAALGDRRAAADAFRRALALDPRDVRVAEELDRLEK